MKSKIKVGDLVLFNPTKKFFVAKQKALRDKENHIAIVLTVIPEDTYLISFDPSAQALVDAGLIEKIEIQMNHENAFDAEESWFRSYVSFDA
jgi:hypothetical protein